MSDLLPCPFCGGEATRLVGKYDFGGDWFETGCDNVGCPVLPSIKTLSQDHADESWNTRADRIAALEPVTVQEARQIADMPPDGTWAVLHPGHYGAFTACALNGKWSMCDDADLRFATHWVPCPFTGCALAERGE